VADVCRVLAIFNTSQAVESISADRKAMLNIGLRGRAPRMVDEQTKVNRIHLGEKPGKPMVLVSESGLYKLIMRSDKPQARLFQDWVTRDVLPAIRKDGAYVMGEEKVASGEMSEDELIAAALPLPQIT